MKITNLLLVLAALAFSTSTFGETMSLSKEKLDDGVLWDADQSIHIWKQISDTIRVDSGNGSSEENPRFLVVQTWIAFYENTKVVQLHIYGWLTGWDEASGTTFVERISESETREVADLPAVDKQVHRIEDDTREAVQIVMVSVR